MIWGGDPFTLPIPPRSRGSMEAGGVVFPWYRLFVIVVAALVGVALWVAEREDAHRRAAARHGRRPGDGRGHGHQRGAALGRVFAAGAALAAFGGVMGGPILGGYAGMDFDLLPLAFVVVIIGGMGSLKGALVGSHRRRHDRQLRQGARARALVLHAVRADGARAGAEANRVVWPSVERPRGRAWRTRGPRRCSPIVPARRSSVPVVRTGSGS